jgi:tryptophan-rich sensory protein
LLVSFVVCFAAAFAGSRFLPDEWFKKLNKPSWNPPNWLFAPVWTVLYALMAIAAWLVWERAGANALPVLSLFALQLVMNAAWTWLFFGLHRPDRAFADIAVLWLLIAATLIGFWQIDALAGLLLGPYLAWVSFATALNWNIWRLNN